MITLIYELVLLRENEMSELNLSQTEADMLLEMEKLKVDDTIYEFPGVGGSLRIPLQSLNKRENFLVDINRGRIKLSKVTYQNRARGIVILARIDIDGPPHRNPDGEELACPHLQIYREGYGTKWAIPLPIESFDNITNNWDLFNSFLKYINVTDIPDIRKGLFT
jgi:hypothetical protein